MHTNLLAKQLTILMTDRQACAKLRLSMVAAMARCDIYLRQGGYVFARLCLSVSMSVCQQDNSKSYGQIFLQFSGNVGNGKNYQRFNFEGDPEGILDSGSL